MLRILPSLLPLERWMMSIVILLRPVSGATCAVKLFWQNQKDQETIWKWYALIATVASLKL
jgi:hypothetical protein